MKQLDISIGTASVITWAFADTSGLETLLEDHDLGGVHLEGFMHASIQIGLVLLKQVYSLNHESYFRQETSRPLK